MNESPPLQERISLEEYYVTVVDQKTDKVLKKIPPKKMLDIYVSMAELMGILVDKKV